jgi:hypothetical protein
MQLRLRSMTTLQDVMTLIREWSTEIPRVFAKLFVVRPDVDTTVYSGSSVRVRPGQARLVATGATVYLDDPGPANVGETCVIVNHPTGSLSVKVLSGAALVEDQTSLAVSTSGGWAFGRNTFLSFGDRGWWRI